MAFQECENGHIYDTDRYPRCPYCQYDTGSVRSTGLDFGATIAPQGYTGGLDYGATVAPQGYGAHSGLDYGATQAPSDYAGKTELPDALDFGSTEAPSGEGLDTGVTASPEPQTEAPAPVPEPKTEAPAFVPALKTTTTAAPEPQEKPSLPIVGWLVCVKGADRFKDFRIYQKFNTVGKSARADVRLRDETNSRFPIWARLDYSADDNCCRLNPILSDILLNGEPVDGVTALNSGDRLEIAGCEYVYTALCGGGFSWDV